MKLNKAGLVLVCLTFFSLLVDFVPTNAFSAIPIIHHYFIFIELVFLIIVKGSAAAVLVVVI